MTIEERLEALERELTRTKRRNYWFSVSFLLTQFITITLFVIALFALPLISKSHPDTITAREFRVVDEKGKLRISLSVPEDKSGIFLYDEKGKLRVGLAVSEGVPGISLTDEKGNQRIMLSVSESVPIIILTDEKGKVRVGLNVLEGNPDISLYDENTKVIWSPRKQ